MNTAGCVQCGSLWLAPDDTPCLVCGGRLEERPVRVQDISERALPFTLTIEEAKTALEEHLETAVMPVKDALEVPARLWAHYVPIWLLDVRVFGAWEADCGISTGDDAMEVLTDGQWQPSDKASKRIEWEMRTGTLEHWFDNLPIPALSTWDSWADVLPVEVANQQERLENTPVLLPDLPPEDAWERSKIERQERIAELVRSATRAKKLRELHLRSEWTDKKWSWLLLPVYVAHYRDHEGKPQCLRVHGRTGEVSGFVAASPKWALFRTTLLSAVGMGLLLVAVLVAVPGLILWPLLLFTGLASLAGFLCLGYAIVPVLKVRIHNRNIRKQDGFVPSTFLP